MIKLPEPVWFQYRWTNPDNNPRTQPSETEWKPVELKHCQTIPEEAALLGRYQYDGKPCYEVRALYTQTPDSDYRAMYFKVRDELAAEQQAHEKTKTTCPSCEALARAVMMDQGGNA